jgi:hypothetical protein
MFSSAAKLAPGLDPAPVLTVGSLEQTPLGASFWNFPEPSGFGS